MVGDLLVSGAGHLGVVTEKSKSEQHTGVLLNGPDQILSPWTGSWSCVLSVSLWDLVYMKKKGRALAMMHLHLKPYLIPGWQAQLVYLGPLQVGTILHWFTSVEKKLLATRMEQMTEHSNPDIRDMLDEIDEDGEDLTDWEVKFVGDLVDRQMDVFSPSQADVIRKIHSQRVGQ